MFHHSCDYIPCMHINSDQSTQNVPGQFWKLSTNQCSKLVQILGEVGNKKKISKASQNFCILWVKKIEWWPPPLFNAFLHVSVAFKQKLCCNVLDQRSQRPCEIYENVNQS